MGFGGTVKNNKKFSALLVASMLILSGCFGGYASRSTNSLDNFNDDENPFADSDSGNIDWSSQNPFANSGSGSDPLEGLFDDEPTQSNNPLDQAPGSSNLTPSDQTAANCMNGQNPWAGGSPNVSTDQWNCLASQAGNGAVSADQLIAMATATIGMLDSCAEGTEFEIMNMLLILSQQPTVQVAQIVGLFDYAAVKLTQCTHRMVNLQASAGPYAGSYSGNAGSIWNLLSAFMQ